MSANLRLSWIGDHDSLKEFVRDNLILQGTWSSPACEKKLFESEGLTILWLKNKKFLAVNGKDAKEIRSRLIEAMCTSSDFAGVNTSVDMATNTENVVDDNISVNHGEVMLHDLPTSAGQAQSSVQFDSTERMENFRTEQMINSETVRSLAESVERLASIVAEIQTNVKSEAKDPCGKCKSVSIKYSQTPTSSDNANVLEQSEELSDNKSEYISNSNENDLEINNDNHHNAKIYESVIDIEHNITKPTYAALVKSQLVKESLSKSISELSLEPTLESLPSVNNNNANGQQSPQLDTINDDGFIGVERKRKRNKKFFLSGIANGVKENHIYTYLTKRNIVPSSILTFQSRRKGTMSAKICIPSTFSKSVLEDNFWPKFVRCKLWQQNETNSYKVSHGYFVGMIGEWKTY
jgi:hypothetical protein